MAARPHHHHQHRLRPSRLCSPSILLLLFTVFLIASLSLFKSPLSITSPPSFRSTTGNSSSSVSGPCDNTEGEWIYDETAKARYGGECKEIYKGWNCGMNGKENGDQIWKWRWKPKEGCQMPVLDPVGFLSRYRDTSIGFVGDSLNRNMFVSLICSLRRVSNDVKKWRPAKADHGFTFLGYNLTIAYHRTNLLARYGRWTPGANGGALESLGYRDGYRVDVDVPDGTWLEAPSFHDIIILNTGHWWWAPVKFDPLKSPMLFYEQGSPVLPPVSPEIGLDMVLKHMMAFVESRMAPGGIKIFRTQSPRHFEGGDWDQGGSCPRVKPLMPEQVEELFGLEHNGTNVEARLVNQHLYKAIKGSSFHILDITHLSEFRADAHPSKAGGKKHDDCMHWCLPGITDTWNDLLVALLNNIDRQSGVTL